LIAEPFVLGIPEIINGFLERLNIKGDKVAFFFSKDGFPGYQGFLTKEKEDSGGA
jgi:hypothetical protein